MKLALRTAVWLCSALALAGAPGLAAGEDGARQAANTTWLTCGGGFIPSPVSANPWVFTPAALRGPRGAENGTDPPALALRAFLAQHVAAAFPFVPAHPYVLLRETSTTALYGHIATTSGRHAGVVTHRGQLDSVIAFVERDGEWQYLNNGGCFAGRVFPDQEATAFDLEGQPSPTARSIRVSVYADSCLVGANPARNLDRVLAVWRPHQLILTFLVGKPPPFWRSCNTGVGLIVHVRALLPRPLGRRTVLNGAPYPPAPVHALQVPPTHRPVITVAVH